MDAGRHATTACTGRDVLAQIFISYRRSDASGHAGRLRDRLRAHFGDDVVFQDVDDIPDGEEFAKVIERALDSCKVALVVIGRNWVNAQTEQGVRRFENSDDWVRTEVGILLRRGIRVVPVLVQGASLPLREELPEELQDLAGRNARELRDSAWDSDVSLLLKSLEGVVSSRRKRHTAITAAVAAAVIGGLVYAGLAVTIGVGKIVVPHLEGKPAEMARDILARDGFKSVHEEVLPSAEFGAGRVVRTEPHAGTNVAKTDPVTIFVSVGLADEKAQSGPQVATPGATAPGEAGGAHSAAEKSLAGNPPSDAATAASAQGEGKEKKPVTRDTPTPPPSSSGSVAAAGESLSVAGVWKITQRSPNGTTADGLLRIGVTTVQGQPPRLTGRVDWNSEAPGRIVRSEVAGTRIMFVLRYADGVEGTYTAVLDSSHTSMTNGLTASNRGDSATWTAKRSEARQ